MIPGDRLARVQKSGDTFSRVWFAFTLKPRIERLNSYAYPARCLCASHVVEPQKITQALNGRLPLLDRSLIVSHRLGDFWTMGDSKSSCCSNHWFIFERLGLQRHLVETLPNVNVSILADSEALCISFWL